MAALNFPSAPSVGNTYTANGLTWQWDGTSWKAANLTTADVVGNTPAGGIAAVNVQDAIDELDSEKQPLDADLTAIAALAGTSGLLKKTATNTWTLDTNTYLTSVTKADIGLGNVENTALSTWVGSANITTLGTVTSGTWSATAIAVAKGGTGATDAATARTNLSVPSTTGGDASGSWGISVTGSSASCTGNAATATTATTATYLNAAVSSTDQSDITTRVNSGFWQYSLGTLALGWPTNSGGWHHLLACTHSNGANYYSMQLAARFDVQAWYLRNTNGSGTTAWSQIVTNSGSWGISITGSSASCTGNAATATQATSATQVNSTAQLNGYAVSAQAISYASGAGGPMIGQAQGDGAAMLSFHRPSLYGVNFGLDTDNVLKVGGWSMGAVKYPILHTGNIAANVPSGSYTLLNTLTASNSVALQDTTNLTSAYDWYEIVLQNIQVYNSSNTLFLRVQTSGGFQATNYYYMEWIYNAGGTAVQGSTTGIYIPLSQVSFLGNTLAGTSGFLRIFRPSIATTNKHIIGQVYGPSSSATHIGVQVNGYWYNGTDAITGVQIAAASGNLLSGVVKIYGVKA